MKLTGNKILITGGGSGIGFALARRFIGLGNEVIITGRNREKLERAKEELGPIHIYSCDSSSQTELIEFSKVILSEHRDMNVLINNAGVLVSRNLVNKSEDYSELTKEIDINIKGTVLLTSLLMEQLISQKGTIINVSSGLAFVPMMSAPIYCGTKAFIHSFTTSLRFQLEATGVDVIELCPPAVKTNMTARLPEDSFFDILTTEALVESTIKGIRKKQNEILPGQAKNMRMLSRIAPSYVQRKLANASRNFMPKTKELT